MIEHLDIRELKKDGIRHFIAWLKRHGATDEVIIQRIETAEWQLNDYDIKKETHQEIAQRLGLSRSRVSEALATAEEMLINLGTTTKTDLLQKNS